jgi:hypothetical protein
VQTPEAMMQVLYVEMFPGPLYYAPRIKTIAFTPKSDEVLIQLSGSATCSSPPDYLGVKPALNGLPIPDPTAPGRIASARIYDDGTPNRQAIVPMAVRVTVPPAVEQRLTLEPLTPSTVTDAQDVFTLVIYDIGDTPTSTP